mmetsp:Transcript_85304/g.244975  ORF Transcript_85304/g.244975 Transcript_85304/m.244975 type:complete len:328 (-) Transcript_85304:1954-2937(-)
MRTIRGVGRRLRQHPTWDHRQRPTVLPRRPGVGAVCQLERGEPSGHRLLHDLLAAALPGFGEGGGAEEPFKCRHFLEEVLFRAAILQFRHSCHELRILPHDERSPQRFDVRQRLALQRIHGLREVAVCGGGVLEALRQALTSRGDFLQQGLRGVGERAPTRTLPPASRLQRHLAHEKRQVKAPQRRLQLIHPPPGLWVRRRCRVLAEVLKLRSHLGSPPLQRRQRRLLLQDTLRRIAFAVLGRGRPDAHVRHARSPRSGGLATEAADDRGKAGEVRRLVHLGADAALGRVRWHVHRLGSARALLQPIQLPLQFTTPAARLHHLSRML